MNVKELVTILQQFPDDLEVTITDGHNGTLYSGTFEIKLFNEGEGKFAVDIGIGGLDVYE